MHPRLLEHKDFIFGYTALHWAAKLGRTDIVQTLVGEKHSSKDFLDLKSHAGFTPLHIASMSGRDEIITQLLLLGANRDARDYSGRRAKDIVKASVAPNIQNKLGKLVVGDNFIVSSLTSNVHPKKSRSVKSTRSSSGSTFNGDISHMDSPEMRNRTKSAGFVPRKDRL